MNIEKKEKEVTSEQIRLEISSLENKIDKVIESNDIEKIKSAFILIKNKFISPLKTISYEIRGNSIEFAKVIKSLAEDIKRSF